MSVVTAVLWWVIVAAGIVPTTWFLVRFRPRWPIRRPSLIINGLVGVLWLGYLRSALVVAASGWSPKFQGVAGTAISLTLGAGIDVLLILMLVTFLRYRRQWQNERSEDGEGRSEERS